MEMSYQIPHHVLTEKASTMPHAVYLRQPIDRHYHEYTWQDVNHSARCLASSFKSLGLKPGDKVAILSKNVAEWFIADFAISMAGMISVPIYPTAERKMIDYVLGHSESMAIFVGKLDNESHANEALKQRPILTIAMPYTQMTCAFRMTELISTYNPISEVAEPQLDDTFSLIYTSGSTGNPKAAVISYRNIAYGARSMVNESGLKNQDRLLSYLPLAHVAERAIIEYSSVYSGAKVTFVESLDTFADDIKNTQPSFFFSVPRLWMKFQSGILTKLPQHKLDRLLRIPLINKLIRRKIKSQLGFSKTRLFGSGTAPISTVTLKWFSSIGIDISEGWGMTETTGTAIMNHPYNKQKVGTIGRPVKGTEVKLSEEGEVLVKSDGLTSLYYKNQEKTAESFVDGWLKTGDKGEIDADGYIRITGRVKEIFKSGKGKYVVPVPIESRLFENNLIEQACVMGAGLPQPVATVVLSPDSHQTHSRNDIQKSLERTLDNVNEELEGHEKLDRIFVAEEEWTVENKLLTPTMKIKRSELEDKYQEDIMLNTRESVVWL